MTDPSAENDAPTRCPNCGGPLTGASHQTVCLINATAEIERLRHPASSDPRTHGGNHSPLPYGVYLAPGFCSGCDQARVTPPATPEASA